MIKDSFARLGPACGARSKSRASARPAAGRGGAAPQRGALRAGRARRQRRAVGLGPGRGDVYFSPRWKAMLGSRRGRGRHDPEEWLGRVHPDDLPGLRARMPPTSTARASTSSASTASRHATAPGAGCSAAAGGARRRGQRRSAWPARRPTSRKRKLAEEQLLHDAFHDAPDRPAQPRLFLDRLRWS